jgi:hypothetical protein
MTAGINAKRCVERGLSRARHRARRSPPVCFAPHGCRPRGAASDLGDGSRCMKTVWRSGSPAERRQLIALLDKVGHD